MHKINEELKEALMECNLVMIKGEQDHEKDSWRNSKDPLNDNLHHAFIHLMEMRSENINLEDLSHLCVRSLMALQLKLEKDGAPF